MEVLVTGKHIDIGDALKQYIEDHVSHKITENIQNFLQNMKVTLSKESHKHAEHYKIDMIITPKSKGEVLKAEGIADTAYKAFDEALGKMENQIHKFKDKVTSHHQKHPNKEIHSFIGSNE